MAYQFIRQEPCYDHILFVLALDRDKMKERILIGTEQQIRFRLDGNKDNDVIYDITRPLGRFLIDFEYDKEKEEKKLRKMSIRKFRKMIYADHFDKNYLELEQKKKELENRISFALQTGKFEEAGKYCDDLEQIINQM